MFIASKAIRVTALYFSLEEFLNEYALSTLSIKIGQTRS